MNQNFFEQLATNAAQNASSSQQSHRPKSPAAVWNNIFAFPPNRDTLGGSAYLIVENAANILIDCPAWDEDNQHFLAAQGGVKWLFLTHRGAIGKTQALQKNFNCEVVIQEQEAYLLPKIQLTSFQHQLTLSPTTEIIWTPGHSPGSSCLYWREHGGVLFSGRHILPNPHGEPVPLRTAKTFHWRRQIGSVKLLLERFTPETLQYICPGANIGFLRGKYAIAQPYHQLAAYLSTLNEQS